VTTPSVRRADEFHGGIRGHDVRPAFGQAGIDHVIVGGGLDLQASFKLRIGEFGQAGAQQPVVNAGKVLGGTQPGVG